MTKRNSYCVEFKLNAIAYASQHGNRAASREFSVDEKSIREWRKEKDVLKTMNTRRRSRRGPEARWPQLEENLKQWIVTQRENHRAVSTVAIKMKARLMAAEKQIGDFKGGANWVYKFMKRNNLSVRARTTVGQHLPDNWEQKIQDFQEFVLREVDKLKLSPESIINMDEVPLSFDIPATRSVSQSGVKTVRVTTTGNERTCFTVVLACSANGTKLKPMVIFKRVTMPREKLPPGIVVHCNKKGWMNCDIMKLWIDKCYKTRYGGFFSPKSLLIFDSMSAHKEAGIQAILNAAGAHIAVIPGGLTSKLQPLDISVNHPFKAYIRAEWDNWITNGTHTFTPSGRQRRATYVEVCKWIISAWNKIKPLHIKNAFLKTGLVQFKDDSQRNNDDSNADSHCDADEYMQSENDLDDSFFTGFQDGDSTNESDD